MSRLSSSKGKLEFKYVSERHKISNLRAAKYAFKNCTLIKLWAEMLLRLQWQIVKWLFKLRFGPELVSISTLKNSFHKKRSKKYENKYTSKHSFNLTKSWKKKYFLIVLHTKISKLNDKKNIDIAAFHRQRSGNYSICLSGQKILAIIFVMKTSQNVPELKDTGKSIEAIFSYNWTICL